MAAQLQKELEKIDRTICEKDRIDSMAVQFMAAFLTNYSIVLNFDDIAELSYRAAESLNRKRTARVAN